MKANVLDLSVHEVVKSLYVAILDRKPSNLEVESYVQRLQNGEPNELTNVIKTFLASAEYASKLTIYRKGNVKYLHTNTFRAIDSYIAFPVYNEAWLPFALACCEYLWELYGLNTVLIVESLFPILDTCMNGFDFLLGYSLKHEYLAITQSCPPSIFISHSHIWKDFSNDILNVCPLSVFMLIGDAFRNNVHMAWLDKKYVFSAISWGFDDGYAPQYNKLIMPYHRIEFYRTFIAECIVPGVPVDGINEGYDVFYVRYWGEGGVYQGMDVELVVSSWVDTVIHHKYRSNVLVIKGDPRVSSKITNSFREKLETEGINCILFEDLLRQIGGEFVKLDLLPVEYSFSKSLLCNAKNHFVLDSSLAYVLAMHDKVIRPVNIVVGVNSVRSIEFSEWATSQIKLFVEHSCDAIVKSPCFNGVVEDVNSLCKLVKLS